METLFVGKNLLFLTEVESTNTYAMGLLRNVNITEGTVVHTDYQSKGKGQRGSVWNSAIASNITASVILRPGFLGDGDSFFLSQISALAVYDVLTDVLNNSQYDIKIKWPNDILVDSKKIAGILIENNYHQQKLQHAVIGIGLNVNQSEFGALSEIATSLKLLSGHPYERNEVLERLCRYIEKWYLLLKAGNRQQIRDTYLSRLKGMHRKLSFVTPEGVHFAAKIVDVDREGKLCLEMDDAAIRRFDIKELRFFS